MITKTFVIRTNIGMSNNNIKQRLKFKELLIILPIVKQLLEFNLSFKKIFYIVEKCKTEIS